MRNGFGLKLLHKFFNLPFLQLQRETLLRQLERNELETNTTIQELDVYCNTDEADYSKFLENLNQRRREAADSNANIMKRSQSGPIIVIGAGKPIPYAAAPKPKSVAVVEQTPITSLEEFCPDGGRIDGGFLDDVQQMKEPVQQQQQQQVDSDSDTDTGNPLVSELQDDFNEPQPQEPNTSVKEHNKTARRPVSDGSSELESDMMKQTNDEFDSTINSEISEITSEALDAWIGVDSKWRRSPEGGEDVSAASQTLDYSGGTVYDDSTSVTSSNVQMELLSSKYSHSPANASLNNSENEGSAGSFKKEKKKKDKVSFKPKSLRLKNALSRVCFFSLRRKPNTRNRPRTRTGRRSRRVRARGGTRGVRGRRALRTGTSWRSSSTVRLVLTSMRLMRRFSS